MWGQLSLFLEFGHYIYAHVTLILEVRFSRVLSVYVFFCMTMASYNPLSLCDHVFPVTFFFVIIVVTVRHENFFLLWFFLMLLFGWFWRLGGGGHPSGISGWRCGHPVARFSFGLA